MTVITGMDVDADEMADGLRTLADEIERGNAPVREAATAEVAHADDAVEQVVALRFLATGETLGSILETRGDLE